VPPRPQTHFDIAGFLTAAAGCAALLYAVSALTSGDDTLSNVLILFVGLLLFLAFVRIEWFKAQRGQEPLLDLRRFKDLTFALSGLALVFYSIVLFGLLFLIPVYLQNLHRETAFQAGLIQTAQALATLLILPLGGKLSDRIGSRPVALMGLILLIATTLLMTRLSLQTPVWALVGILIVLGWANGLAQQIPVSAMSLIEKEEQKEVANGSTLITVLRNIAAPLGVALLSSVVQIRTQVHLHRPASQTLSGELLIQQSSLLAMRDSFLLAAFLIAVALAAMYFVPGKRKIREKQPEHTPLLEEVSPL
jgi:MFS family permease